MTTMLTDTWKYDPLCPPPDGQGVNLWDETEPRAVNLGSLTVPYQAWKGEQLTSSILAIDCETVPIGDQRPHEVPRLVLMCAYDWGTEQVYIVHPKDLARFIRMHPDNHYVAYHAAFDHATVLDQLEHLGATEEIAQWWALVDGTCASPP
jgi:hypothetical protein